MSVAGDSFSDESSSIVSEASLDPQTHIEVIEIGSGSEEDEGESASYDDDDGEEDDEASVGYEEDEVDDEEEDDGELVEHTGSTDENEGSYGLPGDRMDGIEQNGGLSEIRQKVPQNANGDYGIGFNKAHTLKSDVFRRLAGETDNTNGSSRTAEKPLFITDIQDTLQPLQNTADRVTQQIQLFAQSLNSFRQKGPIPGDRRTFLEASNLAKKYEDIVKESSRLAKNSSSTLKGASTFAKSSMYQSQQASKNDPEKARRLDLEAQTWNLVHQLLSVSDPLIQVRARQTQPIALQLLHRYSRDEEIWEVFLTSDHFASELSVMMRWLEEKARTRSKDADSEIAALEAEANRGQGLWAHGWLYTKEAIKGAKRLRSWPQPVDPDDPSITATLLSSERKEPLITQLDPDAVSRQGLGLQQQDQYFEEATWLACWKMLRTGEKWSSIREWAKERLEDWRAVSLCGASGKLASSESDSFNASSVRMMNYRTQESWRAACSVLASSPKSNRYERAVYSLISGETGPAYEVCQSWDDFVYVYFNHLLLTRYHDFCHQFRRKLSYSPKASVKVNIEPPEYESIRNFIDTLAKDPRTAVEAKNPFCTIQSILLGKNYDAFFFEQSRASSKVAIESKLPTLIPRNANIVGANEAALAIANDSDALRVVAHLYLIFQSVGLTRSDTQHSSTCSFNVVRYIDLLELTRIPKVVPLYTSFLPRGVGYQVFAKTNINAVDLKGRQEILTIMTRLKIDIPTVLETQWRFFLSQSGLEDRNDTVQFPSAVVANDDGSTGIAPAKRGLLPTQPLSIGDERLIRCIEWFKITPNQWAKFCHYTTYLYRKFLITGNIGAAQELYDRVQPSEIPVDVSAVAELTMAIRKREKEGGPPLKEEMLTARQVAMESDTMKELEFIILVHEQLEMWFDTVTELESCSDFERIRDLKSNLEVYLNAIMEVVEPMCEDWLTATEIDSEKRDLDRIRELYHPEIFLAYHSSLHQAGKLLGPEYFAECLGMSTVIATSTSLVESFAKSRRMRELVDVLGVTSGLVVSTKKATHKRKLVSGATLDIWDVKVAGDEEDDVMEAEGEIEADTKEVKRQKLQNGA